MKLNVPRCVVACFAQKTLRLVATHQSNMENTANVFEEPTKKVFWNSCDYYGCDIFN